MTPIKITSVHGACEGINHILPTHRVMLIWSNHIGETRYFSGLNTHLIDASDLAAPYHTLAWDRWTSWGQST
ncbi:MAG: hypothetical protein AAF755_04365 [Pseudomonadota bacterium]